MKNNSEFPVRYVKLRRPYLSLFLGISMLDSYLHPTWLPRAPRYQANHLGFCPASLCNASTDVLSRAGQYLQLFGRRSRETLEVDNWGKLEDFPLEHGGIWWDLLGDFLVIFDGSWIWNCWIGVNEGKPTTSIGFEVRSQQGNFTISYHICHG